MFAEPSGFDRAALVARLEDGWRISASSLEYQPVGFGTHHYLAAEATGARWWVNVDDLPTKSWLGPDADHAFVELGRCLATTVALRELGLEFVHAPVSSDTGDALVRLSVRYGVSVFPFIEGRSSEYGEHTSEAERRLVLEALGRLHDTDTQLLPELPRRDPLDVPGRSAFLTTLADLDSDWNGGPYAERTRDLLRERVDHVHDLLDRYDALMRAVREDDHAWVVTHGEPHAANVIWTSDGTFVLIDWDTVAVGPPERDLWMVKPLDGVNANPVAIELFERWWVLSEITGYTDAFRRPHVDDANTRLAWKGLEEYLAT